MPVKASAATGREHHGVGTGLEAAGCREQARSDDASALDQQVDQHRVLVHAHRATPHRGDEGRLDRGARAVASGVQDARAGMRRLETARTPQVPKSQRAGLPLSPSFRSRSC